MFRSGTWIPTTCVYPLKSYDYNQKSGYSCQKERQGYDYVEQLFQFMQNLESDLDPLEKRLHFINFIEENRNLKEFFERSESSNFIKKKLFFEIISEDEEFSEDSLIKFKNLLRDEANKLRAFVPQDVSPKIKVKIILEFLPKILTAMADKIGKIHTLKSSLEYIDLDIEDSSSIELNRSISENSRMKSIDFLYFFYRGFEQEVKCLKSSLDVFSKRGIPSDISREGFNIRPVLFAVHRAPWIESQNEYEISQETYFVERGDDEVVRYLHNAYFLYTMSRQYLREIIKLTEETSLIGAVI